LKNQAKGDGYITGDGYILLPSFSRRGGCEAAGVVQPALASYSLAGFAVNPLAAPGAIFSARRLRARGILLSRGAVRGSTIEDGFALRI
jgi:hypothetical protein